MAGDMGTCLRALASGQIRIISELLMDVKCKRDIVVDFKVS